MSNIQKNPVVSKKILIPFILVTSLFALWGFANDITKPDGICIQKDFGIK